MVGNLVKNALEASSVAETVTISCRAAGDSVEFRIHNRGSMPREAQLQMFQRSYSTKGPGRELGTFSAKLLSERYLAGSVHFTSSAEEGTTFVCRYPREAPRSRGEPLGTATDPVG